MISKDVPRDLWFDDVVVGESFATRSRVISEADIRAFCELTEDRHPLHTDAEYARSKGFPGVIAHGLFCLALMEGLKTETGLYEHTSIASLGWNEVAFRCPVVAGDEVHVEFTFAAKRVSSKGDRGVVTETVRLVDRSGRVVVDASHAALVSMRGSPNRDQSTTGRQ